MAKLAKQAGEVLTPAIRSELQDQLPRVEFSAAS